MQRCYLGYVGDASPIDYGGGYIIVEARRRVAIPGVEPVLEYFHGLDGYEQHRSGHWNERTDDYKRSLPVEIYRVGLEVDGATFRREYENSGWIDWGAIESQWEGRQRIEWGKMDNVRVRAWTLYEAASYHGWIEFDNYPLVLTLGELRTRWEKRLRACVPPPADQAALFGHRSGRRLWF